MAKKPKPEGKKYNYMDTYGDLVTLLMCFFVLLFAMSTIDEQKYNAFVQALSSHYGTNPLNLSTVAAPPEEEGDEFSQEDTPTTGETLAPDQTLPANFYQLSDAIEQYVEENNMQGEVSVEVGESGAVFIRLSDNLLFAGDSSVLSSDSLAFLDFLGECFLAVNDEILQVRLLGHTASIAGSGTDDWILSNERSGRVASYFERTVGFSPYKMQSSGLGRHYPIADNGTAEGLARNRRVDMVVIGNHADNLVAALVEAQMIYFPDDDTQFFEGSPDELPSAALESIPAQGEVDLSLLTEEQLQELYEIANAG